VLDELIAAGEFRGRLQRPVVARRYSVGLDYLLTWTDEAPIHRGAVIPSPHTRSPMAGQGLVRKWKRGSMSRSKVEAWGRWEWVIHIEFGR
jgi:hypothetical protein